ncbi:regulator of chromosome condensation domain-containing protein [Heterostelium album PN500]|uniref:Regulator of chromosome condensation domain-containing protein n=1 Tax=Heterostelium pallidum (strain ATCC 26659 / Pp 5 / PN500) TaxID=670386 RepID=D3AXI6_HETP5|nr:regulator of chromosome condensation domain-containing protein [Heterostelium album PN500]EFA86255.1 regulator of chromosome condensation domain-containing protein [Heterostelium album PN500]|eukprot:XP_020438360.1 regulator of chromosome condensation domain-containing protein [Heterostelium album PN500]
MTIITEEYSIKEWGRVGLHRHYYEAHSIDLLNKQPSRVFSGSSHSIMITALLSFLLIYICDHSSFGSNSCGQLGHGDLENHDFQPIRKFSMLKAYASDVPIQVEIGKDFTLVLTKNGNVYSWGLGDQGQLGNIVDDEQAVAISKLNGGVNNIGTVSLIAAGYSHTLALLSNRSQLYSWGKGSDGQLGHGNTRDYSTPKEIQPTFIKPLDSIKSISCGQFTSYAITSFKEIFSWGQGISLGHSDYIDQLSPKLVTDLLGKNVEYITAGFSHCLAHTSDGLCYAFGQGDYGQLGLGEQASISLTPTLVTQLEPYFIEHISSGWWNSVAIITPRTERSKDTIKRNSSNSAFKKSFSISNFNLSDSMLNLEKLLIEYDVEQSLEMIHQLDSEINSDNSSESDDLLASIEIIDPAALEEHVDLKQKRIVHSIGSIFDKLKVD